MWLQLCELYLNHDCIANLKYRMGQNKQTKISTTVTKTMQKIQKIVETEEKYLFCFLKLVRHKDNNFFVVH